MTTTALSLMLLLPLAGHTTARAGVLPPDAVVGDKTIAEWSAEWWQWVLPHSTNQHPFFDTDGSFAQNGQPGGEVFFVAGQLGPPQCTACVFNREFAVTEGKHLLVPVLHWYVDNVDTFPPLTVEQLREYLAGVLTSVVELHAQLDGIELTNLLAHRTISPVFSVFFESPDSLESYNAGHPVLGLDDPVLADGYWLMVEPLPPGRHVLRFGFTMGPPFNFFVDIADTITVVPVPLEQRVAELLAKVEAANLPSHGVRPLQASLQAARASFARGKVKSGVHHLRSFQHKVREKVAKLDETTAAEWSQAAQNIIDRAHQTPPTTPPGVLPPDAVVGDKTIGEWSAEWWQWVFSIPTNQNPQFDPDGSRAHVGQPEGDVFFLAGVITVSGTVTRRFEVPEGKYLFFPVLNIYSDNVFVDPPLSVEELRALTAAVVDLTSELHASIDGVTVPNLFAHRAVSPVFSFDLTFPDSVESFLNGTTILGLVDPIVSDGFYVMVEPLPPGEHVIQFGGTLGPPFNFSLDITDTLTVVPVPLEQRVEELMAKVEAANLPSKRIRPLLAILSRARASFDKGKLKSGAHHLRTFQHMLRAKVTKLNEATAAELIRAAQEMIDRADEQRTTRA